MAISVTLNIVPRFFKILGPFIWDPTQNIGSHLLNNVKIDLVIITRIHEIELNDILDVGPNIMVRVDMVLEWKSICLEIDSIEMANVADVMLLVL